MGLIGELEPGRKDWRADQMMSALKVVRKLQLRLLGLWLRAGRRQ